MKYILILNLTFFIQLLTGQNVDWPHYGNNEGGTRYVKIDQIDKSNVGDLKIAWTFRTGELAHYGDSEYIKGRAAFEATPIVIDGRMYFSTPSNRIFCLNALDGSKIWSFDSQVDIHHIGLSEMTNRGVTYWEGKLNGKTAERILFGTIDGRLFSLDANNGKPDTNFAIEGFVDLKNDVGRCQVTSAPVTYRDIVITGSSLGDNGRVDMPKGVVKAFSLKTGEKVWTWDPIARDKTNGLTVGAANAWATPSVDPSLGIVYIPTSSPSPDFYGGLRLGNNDCANSLVALEASTGKYLWHFQVVKHDIWDYDIPCQPVLFNFEDSIPAVAIGTKMGHVFVLNRITGEPLLPIEERKVPTSDVPGEASSTTQIFPLAPPPLGLQNITEEDIWGPTESERKESLTRFRSLQYQGIFTPPSIGTGTLVAPGNVGGINWGGLSIHEDAGILVCNINNMAHIISLFPRHDYDTQKTYFDAIENDKNALEPEVTGMEGSPYFMSRDLFASMETKAFHIQTKPPWGQIVGIDINKGQVLWEKPLGYSTDVNNEPRAAEWGAMNRGGAITTAGGLVFTAATCDNFFRAFDIHSGAKIWEYVLPASGLATPMSYKIGDKQFVVIAAGGHGKISFSTKGDYIIAFSL